MARKMYLLSPGHGGKDPGAVAADGTREADIVLSVGRKVQGILLALGYYAPMTRERDVYPTLEGRVQMEHQLKPRAFISLHCNAAPRQVKGVEIWTSVGETSADPLATEIFRSVKRAFPVRNYRTDQSDGDPDKEKNFYVLRKTRCPAVLLEMGFISNADECFWLKDDDTQNRMALAIVEGILSWEKLRWINTQGPNGQRR